MKTKIEKQKPNLEQDPAPTPKAHDIELNDGDFRYAAEALNMFDMMEYEDRIKETIHIADLAIQSKGRRTLNSGMYGSMASGKLVDAAIQALVVQILYAVQIAQDTGRIKYCREREEEACAGRREVKERWKKERGKEYL